MATSRNYELEDLVSQRMSTIYSNLSYIRDNIKLGSDNMVKRRGMIVGLLVEANSDLLDIANAIRDTYPPELPSKQPIPPGWSTVES